jgi:ArsR family transcriptional regulator, arsenate/arsenite/antimonite-responsive transcriptional repressor
MRPSSRIRCRPPAAAGLTHRPSSIYDEAMPDDFSSADDRLALQLKALGHPARLRILDLLAARGTCVCGEIVEVMPLAQATVSQHLKVLKEAGLLRGTVDGARSCYCLDHAAFAELRAQLDRRLASAAREPEMEAVR